MQSLCSVSIVKRGHLLLLIFRSPYKKEKNTKKIKNMCSSEKRMLESQENCQKLVEEVQKYKDLNLTYIFD
jgi:hypothetical protein